MGVQKSAAYIISDIYPKIKSSLSKI